ncbi:MAG: hypothetical protein KF819_12220 [Labilithrix sp.]|nr:hypothetical protein [Labilithrix sp.]
MIDVPPRLLWDYDVAPENELWRLQRILDFFPTYGRDRQTIAALVGHLDALRAPPEVKELVRLYAEHYEGR